MAQLTTLAAVKAALGITGSAQDTQITNLIASASARIELWLNRSFDSGDFTEFQDGGYSITARHAPVKRVYKVGYWDGSIINVSYAGVNPQARVEVLNGIMRLQSIAQPYAVTGTDIPLTGTLVDLVASISAVTGWTASFGGVALEGKASWIPPLAGLDATLTGAPAGIPVCMGDIGIMRVDADSGVIKVVQSSPYFWGIGLNGNGADGFFGVGIYGGGGTIGQNAWQANITPTNAGAVPVGFRGVVLDYTGGPDTIPADVAQACIDMVQYLLQNAANAAMLLGGESIGGYSYTNAGGSGGRINGGSAGTLSGLDQLMRERLAGWARMALPC